VATSLSARGFRVESDLRNETINLKIREHSLRKLPFQVIVGDKEVAAGKVSIRARGGENLGQMSLEEFENRLATDVAMRI